MRLFIYSLLLLCSFHSINAQNGHEIKVKIEGFEEDVLYLVYNLSSKQYIKDTVYRADDDSFTFKHSNEVLEPGLYMVVLPPNNSYLQLLITREEQHFSISTSTEDLLNEATFDGKADDNKLFFRYMRYLSAQRESAQSIDPKINEEKLEAINEAVKSYQDRLILDYPQSLTAAIVKANLPIDYSGLQDTTEVAKWRFTQEHYFDNLDLKDERLLRTPFFQQRVEYFVDKLHVQRPEDIILAIDKVLGMMDSKSETFKIFVAHFLNKYAKSKTVGMDAVYVHMANAYYRKGLAPWIEHDVLERILTNATKLEPLLIGKVAPDLTLETRGGLPVDLHAIDSEFTILYFWRPDCNACKEAAPKLQEFYQAFKDKGVKIAAMCIANDSDIQNCWDYVDENKYNDWIHLADTKEKSNMLETYNIKGTPLIYVLDQEKKIISKRVSPEQLEEVINFALRKR